jgi:hypothetical protein
MLLFLPESRRQWPAQCVAAPAGLLLPPLGRPVRPLPGHPRMSTCGGTKQQQYVFIVKVVKGGTAPLQMVMAYSSCI